MSGDLVIQMAQEALRMVLIISAPMLGLGLLVGLAVSIFQATTSIQEQTLTFVPKFIAIMAIVIIAGNWILTQLSEYIIELFNSFVTYVG